MAEVFSSSLLCEYYDVENDVATRLKTIFHLATFFARREAKTRIGQRDWLKLAGEKIRREQVGSVPTFFVCSREQIRLVENRLN